LWCYKKQVKVPKLHNVNSPQHEHTNSLISNYVPFIAQINAAVTWLHISLKYNQQDATFSRSIYFYKLLYTFQAVPLPIIRSTKLYIQHQVLSNQYCCLLLLWMRWNLRSAAVMVWQYLTLYVQFCAPDDGQRNRLKHVEQFIEINRLRKRCILLVVL